ncbi:ead/Ea22-like family protein [Edwardsiella piscicida]|nr:ead/Ea22-like family protein [Edwardsiella piscicida]ELM3730473.1 ead/Ea22-like family protein [Edwardsiella piscicida]ELV7537989.1 ead/Ea22-like family protein [Edwardsiella piscicida]
MSQVDKQALREAAVNAKIAGEAPVMPFEQRIDALNSFTKLLTPATAIALLDENESLVRANSAQDDHINQQQDRIDRLEKGIYEAAKQISSWRRIAKQNIAEREKDIAELCASRQRIAELEDEKEYISKRFKEADLIVGRNLISMRAAIIEWRATGDAKSGMAWIFNTLIGPGELPSENEKNAQAYFDREDDQIDKEMMDLHKWFWERSKRIEAERAAGAKQMRECKA